MKKPQYTNAIIVSRFPNFRDFLVEVGLVDEETPIYKRVDRNHVKGKTVIGKVPNYIGSFADAIVNIQFRRAPDEDFTQRYSTEDLVERYIAAHEYVITPTNRIYKETPSDSPGH